MIAMNAHNESFEMTMLPSIFQLFNENPILPIVLTLANFAALLYCLFVFRVIQSTQLHANCRFLFTIWSLGFLVVFSSQVALSLMPFFSAHGYLAVSMVDPPARMHAYRVEIAAIFTTAIMEVLIPIERILSSVQPKRYHESNRLARRVVIPILAITIVASAVIAHVSLGDSFVLTGSIFFSLDFFTILMNTVAMKYCRKKDRELGNSSLNVRYQVKESADMASAMQPALIIAFLMKTSGNIVFISTCIRLDTTECFALLLSINWGIMESFFMTNGIVIGVFINFWLMRKHPRLKRNAEKLMKKFWRTRKVSKASIVNVVQKKSETDIYFDNLKKSWE